VASVNDRADRLVRLLDQPNGAGSTGEPTIVRAPGRVNLIGEHTDYNGGFVLPAAIDLEVWIGFRPVAGRHVELCSGQLPEPASFELDGLSPEAPVGGWAGYIAGTAWAMQEAGLATRALAGVLDSTIPVGSGLSSSAAVEMASTWAFQDPTQPRRSASEMALLAQRAENRYVGVNCGIMDQLASAAGRAGNALLIDCRSLEVAYAPLPPDVSVVVCDTAAPRGLAGSAYNDRRRECEQGASIIGRREPGVRQLRDVSPEMFERYRSLLPEVVARRCEHIVYEDDRVLKAVEALRSGDLEAVGRLFAASHSSLRDLFEVSCPQLDAMVEIASSVRGVIAARMTGAGFGGCTVNLVERGAEDRLEAEVLRRYPELTGLTPRVYCVAVVDGAGILGR
jgi:galactokinase